MGYSKVQAESILTFGAGPGIVLKNYFSKPISWCENRTAQHDDDRFTVHMALKAWQPWSVHPARTQEKNMPFSYWCSCVLGSHHNTMHTLGSFSEIDFLTALETGYPRSRFPQGLVSDENSSFGFQMVAFLLWTQGEKGHWLSDIFSY